MGSLASLLFSPSSRSRSRAASCPGSGKSSCLGRAFWGFPSHPCPELPGSAVGTLPHFPRCPPGAQAPRRAPSPLSLDIWSPSDSIFQKKIKNPQTQKRNGKRTFPWKFGVKKKEPLDGAGRRWAALGAPRGLPRECGELLARHCGMTHVKSLRAGNGDAIVLIFWVPFGFSERDASEQKTLAS